MVIFREFDVHDRAERRGLSARRHRIAAMPAAAAGALHACGLLIFARCATRLLSTSAVLKLGSRTAEPGQPEADDAEIVKGLRALDRASRALREKNCLVRAVALRMLLARRGAASTLHLGIRRADDQGPGGKLAGHAWLSASGRVLIGGEDLAQRYTEMRLARTASPSATGVYERGRRKGSGRSQAMKSGSESGSESGWFKPAQPHGSGGLAETESCHHGNVPEALRGWDFHARQTDFKASDFLSNSKTDEVIQGGSIFLS